MATVEDSIYVKTNIGGWFFDAVLRTAHTSRVTITEHPVESGAAMTDHSYVNPTQLVMEIGMTDVARSFVDGQFSDGWSRSTTAYKVLVDMQKQRIPLQVLTRLNLYQNMLIETIEAPDDYITLYGLRATVTMREIFVAVVETVKISARPQVTDSTARGQIEPVKVVESMAHKWGLGAGANQ